MKKRAILIVCGLLLTLAGCGAENEKEMGFTKEPIPAAEAVQDAAKSESQPGQQGADASDAVITKEQALEAIKNYCYENNPDLESLAGSEDVTVYFDVSTSDAGEIVVLYRSYTGAQIRYYVDPSSGDVYVTELVPGIIDEETRTDETFNIREYMNGSNGAGDSRKDGERFETVIILEGMEEPVKYEHAINDGIGIEIDYDYESFTRKSEANKERFISIYDDTDKPENYLEVELKSDDYDTTVAAISDALSKEYELSTDTYTLDNAGNCTRIDASASVGGKVMPDQLQKVYILPVSGGTVVATAHYNIESAEGFGRRFDYMMNTLSVKNIAQ